MTALAEYVQRRVAAGLARAEIREELRAVGWSEEEADAAYRDALIALGVPTPGAGSRSAPARRASTVDVVVNVFSFILLCIVATALGMLYFQVVNRYFGSPLAALGGSSEQGITGAIHYAIASLVVAFPLYLAALRLWFRKFREDEARAESRLTRWLTYLVLLAASVTIVGDFIAVLFRFLQGEGSARFFLKALVILVIAGFIFGFYYLERRRIQYRHAVGRGAFRSFAWGAAGIVVLGIVLGFFAAGSPATARKRAFDMRRETDLSRLASCVENYARDFGELPASLAQLKGASRYSHCAGYMLDPETKGQYPYRVVTPRRMQGTVSVGDFELCATFALPAPEPGRRFLGVWGEHGAGRVCHIESARLGKKAPGRTGFLQGTGTQPQATYAER